MAGAFIVLQADSGARVEATMSGEDGAFELQAPGSGTYRISVRRIGFRDWTSDRFRLGSDESTARSFEVARRPVRLEGIGITAERQCLTAPSEARAARRVWKEARTALEMAAWGSSHRRVEFTTERFVRMEDPSSGRTIRTRTETRENVTGNPYVSIPADSLRRVGFIRTTADSLVFYGPDAEALLSEAFIQTHCFTVVRRGGSGGGDRLGLRFRPDPEREEPDIRGVVWVDQRSGQLTRLEYRYTNLPGRAVESSEYGGEIVFERLGRGPWYVERWTMTLPMRARVDRRIGTEIVNEVAAVKVAGGRVLDVRERTASVESDDSPAGASVFGVVWDSLRSRPLTDATVRLKTAGRSAATDSSGSFSLDGVPPGRRRIQVHHPYVELLGLEPPGTTIVTRRGQSYRAFLATPSRARAARRTCGRETADDAWPAESSTGPSGSSRAVAGRIRLAGDGLGLSPEVRAEWTSGHTREATVGMEWTARRARDGYLLCGVPDSGTLRIIASAPGHREDTVRVTDPEEPLVLREAGLELAPGPLLAGTVYDSLRSRPLSGATVRLLNAGAVDTTGPDGRFSFTSVPSGSRRVDFSHPRLRAVGIDPAPRTVRLLEDSLERVRLAVPGPARVRRALCGEDPDRSRGAVAGRLRLQSGNRLYGGEVAFLWEDESGEHRQRKVRADRQGRFRACGLPRDVGLEVRTAREAAAGIGADTVRIPEDRGLVVHEITLDGDSVRPFPPVRAADTEARQQVHLAGRDAVLIGRVVAAGSGRPLSAARVELGRNLGSLTTDSTGLFVASGLRPGRLQLEVSFLGYRSRTTSLFVPPSDTIRTRLRLETDPVPLPDLEVSVREGSRTGKLSGFRQRRKRGAGKFAGPDEIDETPGSSLHRVFRELPGVDLDRCVRSGVPIPDCYSVRTGRSPPDRLGGERCRTTYYLDGARVDLENINRIPKSRVAAVEVYGSGSIPPRFGGATAGCTVVVLWTETGGTR